MKISFILAQIVGIIILITNAVSVFQKTEKKLIKYNTIANILCITQYLLLEAHTGLLCCFLALVRNIAIEKYKKKVPDLFIIVYSIILVITNLIFINSIVDMIPVLATLVFSYALFKNDIKIVKKSMIFSGSIGSIYDISKMAYTGVILNISNFIAGVKGYIDIKKGGKYEI